MPASDLNQLRRRRKQAAQRKRRVIFNNDGNEPVYYLDEATRKAFLDCRTTPLLGSQVDAIFYCTWSSGFSFFTYDTKVGQAFDTTANPKHPANKIGGFSKNKTRAFLDQGTDPLKMMVEWCKAHGVEIFWSFRMNDTHDGQGAWYSDPLFPQLKRDHPDWLIGSKAKRPPHGAWSAADCSLALIASCVANSVSSRLCVIASKLDCTSADRITLGMATFLTLRPSSPARRFTSPSMHTRRSSREEPITLSLNVRSPTQDLSACSARSVTRVCSASSER